MWQQWPQLKARACDQGPGHDGRGTHDIYGAYRRTHFLPGVRLCSWRSMQSRSFSRMEKQYLSPKRNSEARPSTRSYQALGRATSTIWCLSRAFHRTIRSSVLVLPSSRRHAAPLRLDWSCSGLIKATALTSAQRSLRLSELEGKVWCSPPHSRITRTFIR